MAGARRAGPRATKRNGTNGKNSGDLGFEAKLWQAADKMRGAVDPGEYKHVVLGLIFLKYISDAFAEKYERLKAEPGSDPEDRDEYVADNVFWVPVEARWEGADGLQAKAKSPDIGRTLDDAMTAIERDNPRLKGVLPKDYARPGLDKRRLGELIDLIGTIGLGDKENRSKDILGRVYEYFLGQFASAEGKKGGRHELLSDRSNIVVIADEAHRSQYDFIDGFARHMRDALPNASFIGFTGTPIELTDANTKAVFGNYIDIYDIQQAVEDQMTVPIFYESRLAKLDLPEKEKPRINTEFEEVTEGEEEERKKKLKSKWAALESVVGSDKRVSLIARDLIDHFELRQEALEGKAMVVCMSRRICVALYDALKALRPEWASDDDALGSLKVVMTGSADDPVEWQRHIRTKDRRQRLADRFRDADDPMKVVIVRDMWLTGFDAPPLHTMYLDKPMQRHGLMQAIARVNRVFRDKPGGLVVDYLGLANELRTALATYTQSGGHGDTAIDQIKAVAVMQEKYEVICGLFHGFDWEPYFSGSHGEQLSVMGNAIEHVLTQEDGKERLLKSVSDLSRAFALAVPHDASLAIRDDVGFFQSVRAALAKRSGGNGRAPEEIHHAIRQIVSKALVSDQVVDVFAVAGLDKPDISVLSDEFLAEVRGLPQRNLAVELLQRLLNDTITKTSKKNLVKARSFSDMLGETLRKYQARSIETAQVIEELIQIAKDIKSAQERGEELGLNEEEVAFYDALAQNASAIEVLGDDSLRLIAVELVKTLRASVTVDWTIKETVRAKLRVEVKKVLRKYGYPPDLQDEAVKTVLQQAELLADAWAR